MFANYESNSNLCQACSLQFQLPEAMPAILLYLTFLPSMTTDSSPETKMPSISWLTRSLSDTLISWFSYGMMGFVPNIICICGVRKPGSRTVCFTISADANVLPILLLLSLLVFFLWNFFSFLYLRNTNFYHVSFPVCNKNQE